MTAVGRFAPELLNAGLAEYVECAAQAVPPTIRFDVPGRNRGQFVEVAYGTFGKACAERGDPYMRITDRTTTTGPTFFVLTHVTSPGVSYPD